jgi:hypothetical protein
MLVKARLRHASERLPSTSALDHRRSRASRPEPATVSSASHTEGPASAALSSPAALAWRLDLRRRRFLPARERPDDPRRLLQSSRSASTTTRLPEPHPRASRSPAMPLGPARASRKRTRMAHGSAVPCRTASRICAGQERTFRSAALATIARRKGINPTCLDPDTSCRRLVTNAGLESPRRHGALRLPSHDHDEPA